MVSSTALLAISLLFVPVKGTLTYYLLAAFIIAAFAVAMLIVFARASTWKAVKRIRALDAFSTSVAQLWQSPGVLAYSLLLSTFYWIAVGVCCWIVSLGMPGLSISPLVATLAILGTLYLTTSLPSLPMAVGTFEAAIRYVLVEFFGADEAVSFSYAVLIHAMLYLPPTVIAIAVLSILGLRPRTLAGKPQMSPSDETPDSTRKPEEE
jgi:hypothetical protein